MKPKASTAKARRACRARHWRSRISSAIVDRHGAAPTPAMSALEQLKVMSAMRALPHGGARRHNRALRGLRLYDDCLQTPAATGTARSARGRREAMLAAREADLCGAVLSRGVHAACADRQTSPTRIRPSSTTCCSSFDRDGCHDRPPTPSIWAPASASPRPP